MTEHLLANIGVYAFIIKDKKIFYVHKPNDPIWTIPGGRINEEEESCEKALFREVKEEIKTPIILGEIFAVKIWSPNYKEKRLGVFYTAVFKDAKPKITLSTEHDEYKFFTYEEAKAMLSQEPRGKVGIELITILKEKGLIV